MGYYGSFTFDVEIPGKNVEACEAALRATDIYMEGNDLSELLESIFGDSEAWFDEKPSALVQLADAANDEPNLPDLTWQGYSHQKWRDYAEQTFETIAPYVKSGGVVEVQGEEGEKCRWVFENGAVTYETAEELWPLERGRHERNEAFIQALVEKVSNREHFSPILLLRDYRPELWRQAREAVLECEPFGDVLDKVQKQFNAED